MVREAFDPIDCLRRNWQLLLIASLPGSLLRIWAVWHAPELAAGAADAVGEASGLAMWSAQHGLLSVLTVPLLTIAALLTYEALRDELPDLTLLRGAPAPTAKPLRLDAMTPAARELLAAVSSRGEFRVVPRLTGAAVVAPGNGPNDDREFYDPINREVTQRYRSALAELERAGLLERDGETRRLNRMGWPAARLLTRQELDRIAQRARPLSDAEQRLLRLVADCRQRFKVDKVVVRRDGSAMGAVYGNGQTVPVPDVCPRAEALPDHPGDAAAARFEALVTGIPDDYLTALPERRLGNPFVLRITETGLRYLRYCEIA
ncbi:MAG: hypothetical protein SF182_22990, partial [Deltaproteobacteria bacterium]|nr:hypothetical protein [Deltaproteobacteria bacterium]